MNGESGEHLRVFLATATATLREKRIAAAVALLALVAFLMVVPFVRLPLPAIPAFIPAYEAALCLIDLITAALLFDQSMRLRSIGILALASGYLFDALLIVPHALTFPGAFTPTGMLGAGEQTTAWLYVFWHGGFSLFVMAYAILRARENAGWRLPARTMSWTIGVVIACVVLLSIVLTLLATRGQHLLPVVMRDGDYSFLVTKGVSPAVWVLTLIAMAFLWKQRQGLLQLWLLLVMWVFLFDIALAAVIGSHRFDLGFYAGRIFGLFAASFVLITLLLEMARLYAGLVEAAASAERRIATLARGHKRGEGGRSMDTKAFIVQHNIERYRNLLKLGQLDDAQQRTIEKLLAEEEAKHG